MNPLVRLTRTLEESTALDRPVRAIRPLASGLATGKRGRLLRGEWLGHALHPLLTDAVIGTWTSATLLDLIGGRDDQDAARRLVGIGLLAGVPTALTGWAEWTAADDRNQRVGLVHALSNGIAGSAYGASYLARRRGQHATGVKLALLGFSVAGLGGYLGGHLASARKVGTRHEEFARS
ncbi:DUF2231 domain-containing protein [Nocardioides campestrisoli]|uniref:DUF2231 domain-containing protein n=1 Tax=Nocardioides campestrisoli TaxID=2736757 RepID=UPI0015E7D7BC|nr:DUF2231 domain-containing protein [Nocardioides campestrisoli]